VFTVTHKKAIVMLRKIFKGSKPEKVKIVITLKRRYFTESGANTSETSESSGGTGDTRGKTNFKEQFEENFQKLLKRLSVWIWANKSKSCFGMKMKRSRCK